MVIKVKATVKKIGRCSKRSDNCIEGDSGCGEGGWHVMKT